MKMERDRVDKEQRTHAPLQDQGLQRLQMACESHRPEDAEAFSTAWALLVALQTSLQLPHLPPQLLVVAWSESSHLQLQQGSNRVSSSTHSPHPSAFGHFG